MAGRTVMIELPDELYERLRRRALRAQRGIAAEVVATLEASAMPGNGSRTPKADAKLVHLDALDDDSLWRIARRRVSVRKARRLELLNLKKQRQGLNAVERRAATRLLEEFDQRMLMRAQAALLLKQRGHDVSELVST
jgi:hypothetical protein